MTYLNNALPTRKNLYKWSLSDPLYGSFYLRPEMLQYIVSRCISYLEHGRYTWRNNSVLLFISHKTEPCSKNLLVAQLDVKTLSAQNNRSFKRAHELTIHQQMYSQFMSSFKVLTIHR